MNTNSLQKAIVAGAIGIGVVGGIAWFSSPPQRQQRTVTGVPTEQRPPDIEQGEEVDPGFRPSGVAVSERSIIQRTDPETGELEQEFFYDQLTPREEGVFDMVNPQARLYLSPTRVISLRSRSGRFIAPDNHPQSGQFSDEVVITVFETEPGEKLDLSPQSPHRMLQIELEEAEFDTLLGEIRSGSDVVVTTPATDQVEFAGRGLTLLYNELERRIEYMRITYGRSLRYRPPQEDDDSADAEQEPVADATDEADADELQFYQLTFEQDIVAETADNRIEADRLVAFFSLDRATGAAAARRPTPTPARHAAGRTGDLRGLGRTMLTLPLVLPSGGSAAPPLAQDEPETPTPRLDSAETEPPAPEPVTTDELREAGDNEDLVMTWTGNMVMVPVDHTPPQMGGGDDVFVQFEGRPVRVRLAGGEELVSRSLRYSELSGEVEAIGNASHPMRISSPRIGRATASRLTMNLDEGHARLAGAGSIRTDSLGEENDGEDDADNDSRGLPNNFAASWSDQVDIYFASTDEGPSEIESATFAGDVHVRDDQFELFSETLATRFGRGPGSEEDASPQLQEVQAEGDVSVTLDDGSIAARWLRIETEADADGRLRPARLLAEGDVRIIDARQQIHAGQLAVMLEATDDNGEGEGEGDQALPFAPVGDEGEGDSEGRSGRIGGVAVRHLDAREDVRLLLGDGMIARGDQITADAASSEAHLRGEPVILSRYTPGEEEDADAEPLTELRVPELFLEDEGRLAYADGSGVFTYLEPATEAGQLDQRVRVNWSRRMQYDDATQTIEVHGQVVAEAEDGPTELNRLTSRMLSLELVDPAVLAEAKGESTDSAEAEADDGDGDGDASDEEGMDAMMGGERQLHRLVARGDAVLEGTRWADETRNRVLTRFRVAGPELRFDNVRSVARVEGNGSLLVEDYRPADDPVPGEEDAPAADESADPAATEDATADATADDTNAPDAEADAEDAESEDPTPAAPLSGRGATLFTWTDELELDEAEADMRMIGRVRMTHRPMGGDDVVELRTDSLVADMESMRGLSAMGMSDVDSMNINHIAANGNVQVHDAERMITAGQLYYDGPARTILLQRGEQRNVQVIRVDQPRPLRASEILWNLTDDTLEILDAGL